MNRSNMTARNDAEVIVERLLELVKQFQRGAWGDEKEALTLAIQRILIGKTAD